MSRLNVRRGLGAVRSHSDIYSLTPTHWEAVELAYWHTGIHGTVSKKKIRRTPKVLKLNSFSCLFGFDSGQICVENLLTNSF